MGGYSYCEVLLDLIKKRLNNDLIYLQPSRPCLAIMEEAVLFGKKPSIIDLRRAKYTIGVSFREIWNEKKHSEKGTKVFDKETNQYFCLDCFLKYIEINQSIKLEEKITETLVMIDKRYCTINFYKTIKPSPNFIFEEGMIFIGKCKLDAGKEFEKYEDREIKVTLQLGGTFIKASAIHIKSGNKVKAKLIFD